MGASKATAIESTDPATGEVIARYPGDDEAKVARLLDEADAGSPAWRGLPVKRRAGLLTALAATLEGREEAQAGLITAEMGKSLREPRAEVQKCADPARWYAERGPTFLADEPALVGRDEGDVSYLPIGIVPGIMPWNLPPWQVLRAAVPIPLGGNAFLLKHAPKVLRCADAPADVFEASGYPTGVSGALNIGVEEAAALILGPPHRGRDPNR